MKKLLASVGATAALLGTPATPAEAQNTHPAMEINNQVPDVPVSLPGGENPVPVDKTTTTLIGETATSTSIPKTTTTLIGEPASSTSVPNQTSTTVIGNAVSSTSVEVSDSTISNQDPNETQMPLTGSDSALPTVGGLAVLGGAAALAASRRKR